MPFTPETLAKAQATRRLRAAERKQAKIDKRDGVQRVLDTVRPLIDARNITQEIVKKVSPYLTPAEPWRSGPYPQSVIDIVSPPLFNFSTAPLNEAITELAKLKREYDAAAQIVLARSAATPVMRTCWTQFHKDTVPHSVQKLCKKQFPDGKQAFRDDGVFKIVDGIRIPDPVFCCNFACYETYQRSRQFSALSRH